MKNSLDWRSRVRRDSTPVISPAQTVRGSGAMPKGSNVGKTQVSPSDLPAVARGGPKLASYTQRRVGHGKGK